MNNEYITIYKDKNGEWKLKVSAMIRDLDFHEIEKMRSIIITAIYIVEDMWRREKKKENISTLHLIASTPN